LPQAALRPFIDLGAANATISSAGYGSSSDKACSFEIVGSSQMLSAAVGRITGIRS